MKKLFALITCLYFSVILSFSASAELNLELPNLNLPDLGGNSGHYISAVKEAQQGLMVLRNLRARGVLIENPEINLWIRSLGNKLSASAPNSATPFYFAVSKDLSVNAFATIGGVVIVNAGLILRTDSESELAAVMSHEIAHITQRHIQRMIEKAEKNKFISDIIENIGNMPSTMKRLGVVQFFSWFAFFTMWSMANPALTEHVFQTPVPIEANFDMAIATQAETFNVANTAFQKSSNLVGSSMGIYGLSSMVFALLLVLYTAKRRINRKYVHMISLILGGLGFISMYYTSPETLKYSFVLIGFAWGSILSMPYAMLSSSVDPKKMGVFMGIFNMFIVIPQIIAALGGINYVSSLLGDEAINAMTVAGISLLIAGLCNLLITNKNAISYQEEI